MHHLPRALRVQIPPLHGATRRGYSQLSHELCTFGQKYLSSADHASTADAADRRRESSRLVTSERMNSSSFEMEDLNYESSIDYQGIENLEGFEITDVLPPPNHEDLHVRVMAVGYLLLFLVGTCGNVAVLTTIYHVIRSRRATLDNTLIYVIVLSCVDFGVCLSLPFTVIDQILGFWMFGSVPCKLHAVFENFGKILSALILTAMSFDRYAGVCLPQQKRLRSRSFAYCALLGLSAYALVTLCPLLWSFSAKEVVLFKKQTGPMSITRMKVEKCTMMDISSTIFTLFTIYQFILCYCVPLLSIAYFYSKLLTKLREHARQFKASQIPLMRISLYTLAVACFYFLSWTPFWMATVFAVYLEYAEDSASVPPLFVYCMYFIHALPFTNSAVNWVLYGALNGQLQQRYRGSRSNTQTNLTTMKEATGGGTLRTQLSAKASLPLAPSPSSHIASSVHETLEHSNGGSCLRFGDWSTPKEDVDVRLLPSHSPTFL